MGTDTITTLGSEYAGSEISTLDRNFGFAERLFSSSSYHSLLLEGFTILRENNQLCDVTLVAGKERFNVHRVLLAACSPYFRNLFANKDGDNAICRPMKDNKNQKSKRSKSIKKKDLPKIGEKTAASSSDYQNTDDFSKNKDKKEDGASSTKTPPSPSLSIKSKFSFMGGVGKKSKKNSTIKKEPLYQSDSLLTTQVPDSPSNSDTEELENATRKSTTVNDKIQALE